MDDRAGILQGTATAGQNPTFTSTSAPTATAPAPAPAPHTPSVTELLEADFQSASRWRHFQPPQARQQAAPSVKSRRSKFVWKVNEGCMNCRGRKVSCPGSDVAGGPCKDCVRLNYDCSFVSADQERISRVVPNKDRTEAGFPRRRAQKACTECHIHKTRCSGDTPRCKRCEHHGLACEYVASKRKFSHVASLLEPSESPGPLSQTDSQPEGHASSKRWLSDVASLQPPSGGVEAGPSSSQVVKPAPKPLTSPVDLAISSALPTPTRRTSADDLYGEARLFRKDILWKHFDVFFRLWAPQPCMGIMQRELVHAEIDQGRLHPIVAAAVCAMTSRIVHPGQNQIDFADRCAHQVELYLFRAMDSFLRKDPHENLIVLVCAICHFWHENQMGKVWMYMGLAGRLIKALQYNWEGAGESLIRQEANRRLVWACFILDRLLAGGFDEHLVLREDDMHLTLPVSNEVLYEAVRAEETSGQATILPTLTPKSLSLDGYHLRLHMLRHHILGMTKQLTSPTTSHPRRSQLEASDVISKISRLQIRLTNFNQSLPEDLKFNDANTTHFMESEDGPSFIMLHSLFWILHVDLYRFTIPGIREEANPELARELPPDFVHKSQRQAVGYAVSLARFWRNLQAIVAQRPAMDGTERLLTVDQMFAIHVIQPTKILLAARQNQLFDNLEDSTAPLVRHESVDDSALALLVASNMRLIPPFARFFPRIMDITQDLREAVNNFTHSGFNDKPGAIGAPAVRPSADYRLPGPHYVLENALIPQVPDQRDKEKQRQRNKYAADNWLSQAKKTRQQEHSTLMTPPMAGAQEGEGALLPVTGPEIPIWLAEARGCEPLPDTPPQDTGSGATAGTPATQALVCSSHPGVGLGLSNAYLYDRSWSMPTPQAGYDMTVDQMLGPLVRPGVTGLLYERARGSSSTAIPPPMHAGGGSGNSGGGVPDMRRY